MSTSFQTITITLLLIITIHITSSHAQIPLTGTGTITGPTVGTQTQGSTGTVTGPTVGTQTQGSTGAATTTGESSLELYMHDILGGMSPTARPITGLLGNIYSGQVPFARPIGFNTPRNGVAIPNSNGAVPTYNGNTGIPLDTGLSGSGYVQAANGPTPANQIQTQLGPDGLSLGFGTITVIDDVLTAGPNSGDQRVGKAQGVYVASSADGTTQMMAFTAMMEDGEYGDTLNFFGVYKIGTTTSRLSVTGGTGKFKGACGFAEVRPLIPSGQHVSDGAVTLLRITVNLNY